MAGWNKKSGELVSIKTSEDKYWSLFNYVFSVACSKRNTYKFGLIKSLLDNLFNFIELVDGRYYISYYDIFSKFAENYWNLVVKYKLKQMRPDGKSVLSRIERIFYDEVNKRPIIASLEFESLDDNLRMKIENDVTKQCKMMVVGALYNDFEGLLYSFDLNDDGLYLCESGYQFLLKYKCEIENLNYYAWAKFLETINNPDDLLGIIGKLELSTPQRSNLAIYQKILFEEFQQNNCFYCGKKLLKVHVDHFIPWSFVKDDKIWNFVLSCPSCNNKKKDKIAPILYLNRIESRNISLKKCKNALIVKEFKVYNENLLDNMWRYAQLSGFKVMK